MTPIFTDHPEWEAGFFTGMATVGSAFCIRGLQGSNFDMLCVNVGGGINLSNSLIVMGVITVLVAVVGMFHFKGAHRRRQEEQEFVFKTLAPGAAAVMLVLFFAFGKAKSAQPSQMQFSSKPEAKGVSVPIFSTACVVAFGIAIEMVRKKWFGKFLGRSNRSSSQTLHPVRIRKSIR